MIITKPIGFLIDTEKLSNGKTVEYAMSGKIENKVFLGWLETRLKTADRRFEAHCLKAFEAKDRVKTDAAAAQAADLICNWPEVKKHLEAKYNAEEDSEPLKRAEGQFSEKDKNRVENEIRAGFGLEPKTDPSQE